MSAARLALDAHRRELASKGERITLRRGVGADAIDLMVRARVTSLKPDELIGNIKQGDLKIIILAEDVTFDPPLSERDKVQRDGKPHQIVAIDREQRRVGGVLIAYEIVARG